MDEQNKPFKKKLKAVRRVFVYFFPRNARFSPRGYEVDGVGFSGAWPAGAELQSHPPRPPTPTLLKLGAYILLCYPVEFERFVELANESLRFDSMTSDPHVRRDIDVTYR